MLGINAGILIIGKYSPLSIIFIFLPGYLLTVTLIKVLFPARMKFLGVSIILSTIIALLSISQILPWTMNSYNKYIQTIRSYIPDDTRTLANLNSSFAFAYGDLYIHTGILLF